MQHRTKIVDTNVWSCEIDPSAPETEHYVCVECPIGYRASAITAEAIRTDPSIRVITDQDTRDVAELIDRLGRTDDTIVLRVADGAVHMLIDGWPCTASVADVQERLAECRTAPVRAAVGSILPPAASTAAGARAALRVIRGGRAE